MTTAVSPTSNLTSNEPSSWDIAQASAIITLGAIVCFCSFLTIFVVHKFRSVTNPDILILALAIIDFVSSLTVFPMAAFWYLRTVDYPEELCLVYGALTTSVQLASTVIVSLMTVDRFLAIRSPILYKTRLGSPQLKRLVVIVVLISTAIGSLPAALSTTGFASVANYHGYCTFGYSSNFTFVILAISIPQIPLIAYSSYGFLVSIKEFMKRRQPRPVVSSPSSSSSAVSSDAGRKRHSPSVPSSTVRWDSLTSCCRAYCCKCCCRTRRKGKATSKDEMVEKTHTVMKKLNLKRCTRMSKTVALVVAIYYVPWLLALALMVIELSTDVEGNESVSTLHLVTVRLMMAHSIFYPLAYSALCGNYRRAYKWALSLPFTPCGMRWRERPPLGLTVSERHRISHQMALEEWESPGLNRRMYSKRPYLKRSTTGSLKDATNVEADVGQDNPAFDNQNEANEVTSSDQNAEDIGLITVEIVHENASRRASTDDPVPSTSSQHQIVPVDSPEVVPRRPGVSEESKQGTSSGQRRSLENQTSDSGVDVDSIHLDSAPSGSNSPAVNRLQTVESESSTSVSEVAEHLARVDERDAREKETSFISEPNGASDKIGMPNINVTETRGVSEQTTDNESNDHQETLKTVARKIDSETAGVGTVQGTTAGATIIPTLSDNTLIGKDTDVPAKFVDVATQIDDATATNDDTVTGNSHVNPRMTADKSTSTDFIGYSISETSPGRKSNLRVEPCSACGDTQGLISIHLDVVELQPEGHPLPSDTCSLQSKTRQYHAEPGDKKPTLRFSMAENRFVPCAPSFEETDAYSLDLSGKNTDDESKLTPAPALNVQDADDATQNARMDSIPVATNDDVDDGTKVKGLKSRRMRASRAMRESARYSDDITKFSEMVMRKQNQSAMSGVKEDPSESEAQGSP